MINVITRTPTDRVEGLAAVTLGIPERGAQAMISGPLVPDRLAAELAVRWNQDQGQVDDIATGATGIDEGISRFARLKLRHAPTGGPLALTLTATREELESHEELYILREGTSKNRSYDSATQGDRAWLDRQVTTLALAGDYGPFGSASPVERDILAEPGHDPCDHGEHAREPGQLFAGTAPGLPGPASGSSGVMGGFRPGYRLHPHDPRLSRLLRP